MNEESWRLTLGAIADEVSKLETACVGEHANLLTMVDEYQTPLAFIPPKDLGTIPAHMVVQARDLQNRIKVLEIEVEHALRLAAQGLAVSHELARNVADRHPQFIDASL
ncbi:MAG: hypothetical protein ACSLFB_13595 [Acidimicrobiales bacterium]